MWPALLLLPMDQAHEAKPQTRNLGLRRFGPVTLLPEAVLLGSLSCGGRTVCNFYHKLPLSWLNLRPATPNNARDGPSKSGSVLGLLFLAVAPRSQEGEGPRDSSHSGYHSVPRGSGHLA